MAVIGKKDEKDPASAGAPRTRNSGPEHPL